jgi:hypothetical protein
VEFRLAVPLSHVWARPAVGELGGLRIGASRGKRTLARCSHCRRLRWVVVEPVPGVPAISAGPIRDEMTRGGEMMPEQQPQWVPTATVVGGALLGALLGAALAYFDILRTSWSIGLFAGLGALLGSAVSRKIRRQ